MNVLYIENYLLLLYDFDRDEAPKPTTALDYTFGRRAKTGHNIVSSFPIKSFIDLVLQKSLIQFVTVSMVSNNFGEEKSPGAGCSKPG